MYTHITGTLKLPVVGTGGCWLFQNEEKIQPMKITWTFYPKYEPKLTLIIKYLPTMDKPDTWGFLHVETNQAWVCWDCFKVFDRGDIKAKKDAFARLIRIKDVQEGFRKIEN